MSGVSLAEDVMAVASGCAPGEQRANLIIEDHCLVSHDISTQWNGIVGVCIEVQQVKRLLWNARWGRTWLWEYGRAALRIQAMDYLNHVSLLSTGLKHRLRCLDRLG